MSKKPPEDEDPLLQEILRQIKDSFVDQDHNPFVNSDLFDVLSQEISSSIAALTNEERNTDVPDICVVEGGLVENDEKPKESVEHRTLNTQKHTADQEAPQLHIANPKDYAAEAKEKKFSEQMSEEQSRNQGLFSSLFGSEDANVEVRVFGPDDFDRIRSELNSKESDDQEYFREDSEQSVGLIHLAADETQPIFKGHKAKIYRVCLEQGEICILEGQEEIARVKAGQSCDVEGADLYVRSIKLNSEGWYSCIV